MNAANIDRTAGTSIHLKDGDIGETKPANDDHEVGESSYVRPRGPEIFGIQLLAFRSPIAQTFIITLVHSLVVRKSPPSSLSTAENPVDRNVQRALRARWK